MPARWTNRVPHREAAPAAMMAQPRAGAGGRRAAGGGAKRRRRRGWVGMPAASPARGCSVSPCPRTPASSARPCRSICCTAAAPRASRRRHMACEERRPNRADPRALCPPAGPPSISCPPSGSGSQRGEGFVSHTNPSPLERASCFPPTGSVGRRELPVVLPLSFCPAAQDISWWKPPRLQSFANLPPAAGPSVARSFERTRAGDSAIMGATLGPPRTVIFRVLEVPLEAWPAGRQLSVLVWQLAFADSCWVGRAIGREATLGMQGRSSCRLNGPKYSSKIGSK